MKRFVKKSTISLSAVLLTMTAIWLTSPDRIDAQGAGGPPTREVVVTNTPLPVLAQQSGIWSVNVTSLPATTGFAREPVFVRLEKNSTGLSSDYTVPSGHILVIESIDISAYILAVFERSASSLRIRPMQHAGTGVINASNIQFLQIPLDPIDPRGDLFTPSSGMVSVRHAVGRIQTRLYVQSGGDIVIGLPPVTGVAGSSDASGLVNISGYLVPVGSPSLAP